MPLNQNINKLRTSAKMTQMEFAEKLGVSHQSVQKWESGQSQPELDKLVRMSNEFGVSVDCLLFDTNRRELEEIPANKKIFPSYDAIPDWELYSEQLEVELRQCSDEGLDISEFSDVMKAVSRLKRGEIKTKLADTLFSAVLNAKTLPSCKYFEPSELASIKSSCKAPEKVLPCVDKAALREKIKGAWYGRIAGCMLGKTVEGIRTNELHPLLKESGNFPMHRYIKSTDITPDMLSRFNFRLASRPYADKIDCMPTDDDTNYTALYQVLISKYGRSFKPQDVASLWLKYQPKDAYCTAERVAFKNFVDGYAPPHSAVYKNPYREWIGAQIRADYFGYINPGDPAMAAEMAWRDACISHVKNGIYGEMYIAAAITIAAVCNDIPEILKTALCYIPEKSRLCEAVSRIIERYENGISCDDAFADIHARWNEYDGHDWCHTISNCEIVVASLLYGGNDYGKSICLAVQTGFDTDCNGATVGSILGMKNGISSIGEEWTVPFNGKLETTIFGVGTASIEKFVDKTMEHIG